MDISNGSGIGVSLFVQGCHFHCHNCFNPETWDFSGGKEWTDDTKEYFISLVSQPFVQRVSILGGEPLADENVIEVSNLIDEISLKFPDKKIWLYTGYELDEKDVEIRLFDIRHAVMRSVDVLVDGRYVDEERDFKLKFCGSRNQRVIDMKASIKNNEITLLQS